MLSLVGGDCSAREAALSSRPATQPVCAASGSTIARYGGGGLSPERRAPRADRSYGGAQVCGGHAPAPARGTSSLAPAGAQAAGGGSGLHGAATAGAHGGRRRSAACGARRSAPTPRRRSPARGSHYAVQPFFTRGCQPPEFRILLLVVDPSTGPTQLGHNVPPLYDCQPGKFPPTEAACAPGGGASAVRSAPPVCRSASATTCCSAVSTCGSVHDRHDVPAREIPGGLTAGLPAGFGCRRLGAGTRSQARPARVRRRLHDPRLHGATHVRRPASTGRSGSGSDELESLHPDPPTSGVLRGRRCSSGPGACAALHDMAGAVEFPGLRSRARPARRSPTIRRCSRNYRAGPRPPSLRAAATAGALGEALRTTTRRRTQPGWDMAQDMMQAVSRGHGRQRTRPRSTRTSGLVAGLPAARKPP